MGEGALRIERPAGTDARALETALRAWSGVTDAVVTEGHLLCCFDPARPFDPPSLPRLLRDARSSHVTHSRHTVRVRYDGEDLEHMARHADCTVAEVIALHASVTYTVTMLGFLPGFAYLGEVPDRLRTPRLASPRRRVPRNAVALAGARTAIYPCASPGGWNLLGTAVDFVPFDPARGATLRAGDRIRFEPV